MSTDSPIDRDISVDRDTSGHQAGCVEEACTTKNCHTRGWRKVVINFTPSWFSVNMGTGITSILLHNLPYNSTWLYWISVVLFCLNIFLFIIFLGVSLLRYTLFRGMWSAMTRHPVQSLFVGNKILQMYSFGCPGRSPTA